MLGNLRLPVAAAAALFLAGCATVNIDGAVQEANRAVPEFTQGHLQLNRTAQQREQADQLTNQLLAGDLAMDGAVQIALANSPSVQALIAESWGQMATADQSGRIPNPVFAFERIRSGDELELGRLLSFGLLDLLTLPQRRLIAGNQVAQGKVQLTASVVEQVSQARQAWVRAVAARQVMQYAEQVNRSAEASAELARRLEKAGNFSKLQRARQHLFYADATAQLASARHAATAAREELVRQLGLTDAQAARLQLPDRLPDLPKEPRGPGDVTTAALQQRLDVQLARLQLEGAGRSQSLNLLTSLTDVEAGIRRDTIFDGGEKHNARGYELEIRLPIFDWGNAQRAGMNARSLAAVNRYEAVTRSATSQLRESYSAYRTAYDLAKHYRDEIVPLRKTMSEENVLRYNGMLIGVFELLADSRDQIASVIAAINAQQQFWLANAGLSSALIGRPAAMGSTPVSTSTSSSTEGGH